MDDDQQQRIHTASSSDPSLNILMVEACRYGKQGYPVFPLIANRKKPYDAGGFHTATTDFHTIVTKWREFPNANIGIPTGEASGLLVLDVDNKNGGNGNESLLQLMAKYGVKEPPVTWTSTTPSGGLHYYFRYPAGRDLRNSASGIGKHLDIRANGGYIVAPPSQIDGKSYLWLNSHDSIIDTPDWLIEAIEGVGAKEKKAENPCGVEKGGRNNYIFKLACDLRDEGLPIEDAAKRIIKAAAECVPPLPEKEALRTLESAYHYEGQAAVRQSIDELNASHALVMLGGKCRIMIEEFMPNQTIPELTFSSPADFKLFQSNKTVVLGNRQVSLVDQWIKSPYRRDYKGIVFSPGTEPPEGYFNLWRGFAVTPRQGDCSLYLQHIHDNIANGNAEIYNYFLSWMADVVQNPGKLTGTAIAVRGEQGTGKGMVFNQFGALFGKHFVPLNSSKQLLSKFNSHLGDAILVFADEAFWGGDRSAEGTLKALITEPTLLLEKKGYDIIQVKNHVHLVIASNNDWLVPAGFEERRFLVLDASNAHRQDHAYFEAIDAQMNNGGREALLHLLLNYDLSQVNLRKLPKTKALLDTKLQSMSPIQKFWYGILQSGRLDPYKDEWGDGSIPTERFRSEYLKFATDMGVKHRASAEELRSAIDKLVPSVVKLRRAEGGGRPYYYQFPPLMKCRKFFEEKLNSEIEWSTGDSEDSRLAPEAVNF